MRAFPRAGFVTLMLLTCVALTQCRGGKEVSGRADPLPSGIDLTHATTVEVQDATGQVVLSGTFAEHKTALKSPDPSAKANGAAETEVEKDGAKQELEAKVEDLPPNTAFKILVDGKEVANFMTDGGGKRTLKYTRDSGT